MDRSCFLSSQPFLVPTSLSSWPRSEDRCIHVLLQETFSLSIEAQETRPAFFVSDKKVKDADPAMSSIELALDATIRASPQKPETKTLLHKSPENSSKYDSLCLYARIDGRIYAINVAALQSVERTEPQQDDQGNTIRPASLVMQFAPCTFRIFSTYQYNEDEVLEQTAGHLNSLLQTHSEQVWYRGLDQAGLYATVLDSPSSSGSRRNKESPSHQESSSTTSTSAAGNQRKRPAMEPFAERLQRRRRHYQESQDGLQRLETVLEWPVKTVSQQQDSPPLGALLTRTAESLAAAMRSPDVVEQAAEKWESKERDCRDEMHQIVQAHFPAPRTKAAVTTPVSDGTVLADRHYQMEKKLQHQKQAFLEHSKLCLLPSRG